MNILSLDVSTAALQVEETVETAQLRGCRGQMEFELPAEATSSYELALDDALEDLGFEGYILCGFLTVKA